MNKINFMLVSAACMFMISGCASDNASENTPYKINLFADQPALAEVWMGDDYDPTAARDVVVKRFEDLCKAKHASEGGRNSQGGACSAWHKDNFHGRNIDWNMCDFATIIVHMPKNESKGVKYASISLSTGDPGVNVDFIKNNKEIPEVLRMLIPAVAVDGINECGVSINHNIVPYEGKPCEKNGGLPSPMICRYVLDNCATAREAIDSLGKKSVSQTLVNLAGDYSHFFISDPTSSYAVEWIDGEFTATEFKADGHGNYISASGEPAIMTNYFVGLAEKYGLGTKEFFRNHEKAMGYERALTIKKQLPEAKTVDDHFAICKSVWNRQYCLGETAWYSDLAGNYGYDAVKGKAYWWYPTKEDIHWMDNDDIYAAAKAALTSSEYKQYYTDFKENWDKCVPNNPYWYTQHSVVYDLQNLKGYILMQEGLNSNKIIEISVE